MACRNAVQQKLPCVFEISVAEGSSRKRPDQRFRVEATDKLCPQASGYDLDQAWVSEKIDGTCCYVADFQGRPWLWARLDRKLSKAGERKMRGHHAAVRKWREGGENGPRPRVDLNVSTDCKTVPENWIPASGVLVRDGQPQPDENGHTPGWVPVELKSRQYVWHLTPVDLKQGLALLLRESVEEAGGLVVECVPLHSLSGHTLELIGTHINGNPYGLGSKQTPVHLLVTHGSIGCPTAKGRQLSQQPFVEFFEEGVWGQVEGVVWHCPGGAMFKLHRHHLGLPWPVAQPLLSQRELRVQVDPAQFESSEDWPLFQLLSALHSQTLASLRLLHRPAGDST